MRGKVIVKTKVACGVGITPAYAGKREEATVVKLIFEDHPRLCGEKPFRCTVHVPYYGSPPPMRGKDVAYAGKHKHDRITPAYAGKSTLLYFTLLLGRDHPRLCGEKIVSFFFFLRFLGSPPPMRGKGWVKCILGKCGGITPAYAGKRQKR